MLVVRLSRESLEHRAVRDLPEYLEPGDLAVFNDTAVAPARFFARRGDAAVEGLFLAETGEGRWRLMLKNARRFRPGDRLDLLNHAGTPAAYALELMERDDDGHWIALVTPPAPGGDVLDAIGHTPLPPYILRARADRAVQVDDGDDRRWYQTVYADPARRRSVAAPTAGLHFDRELLGALDTRGVRSARVTLHVGPGTFRPVTADTLDGHVMHREAYEVSAATVALLRAARAPETRTRIIAIGTTTVRTLESLPHPLPVTIPEGGIARETDLLIAPPYDFRLVDGLLTNFHLPRSTLLALVGALVGLERLLEIYAEAVRREYRFYSYGDAMLVVP